MFERSFRLKVADNFYTVRIVIEAPKTAAEQIDQTLTKRIIQRFKKGEVLF